MSTLESVSSPTISVDTVWDDTHHIVLLEESITVLPGVTLSLRGDSANNNPLIIDFLPGVEIRLAAGANLILDTVVFGGGGDGIRFLVAESGTLEATRWRCENMNYCMRQGYQHIFIGESVFQDCHVALEQRATEYYHEPTWNLKEQIQISNSLFLRNEIAVDSDQYNVKDSVFAFNAIAGRGSELFIHSSILMNNGKAYLEGKNRFGSKYSDPLVDCIFYQNEIALQVEGRYGLNGFRNVTFLNNTVGVQTYSGFAESTLTAADEAKDSNFIGNLFHVENLGSASVNLSNTFWGPNATVSSIRERILDIYTDPEVYSGAVILEPIRVSSSFESRENWQPPESFLGIRLEGVGAEPTASPTKAPTPLDDGTSPGSFLTLAPYSDDIPSGEPAVAPTGTSTATAAPSMDRTENAAPATVAAPSTTGSSSMMPAAATTTTNTTPAPLSNHSSHNLPDEDEAILQLENLCLDFCAAASTENRSTSEYMELQSEERRGAGDATANPWASPSGPAMAFYVSLGMNVIFLLCIAKLLSGTNSKKYPHKTRADPSSRISADLLGGTGNPAASTRANNV